MKLFQLSALAAAAVLLVACGGSDEPAGPQRGDLLEAAQTLAELTPAQIDAATAASGLQALTGAAQCGVKVVALNYATVGAQGEAGANASGALLLPTGAAGTPCTAAAPLLAYARGTDVDKLRTMANPQDGETLLLMAVYAAQGYAVVATDYLGYAKSGYAFHPYLHADSEATAVIDSVRAARNAAGAAGAKLSGKVMFSGYSQGGHASMSAQRAAERDHAKEFNVVAGAHLAGPYNLTGALKVPDAIAGYQFFVPFIITAWDKVYGDIYAKPEDAFKAPYASDINDLLPNATLRGYGALLAAGKLPAGTPSQARDALMQPAFLQEMQANAKAPISVAAGKNTLFGWKPKAPVLLCGGAGDPTVPPVVHQAPMQADFAHNGVTVTSVDVDAQIQATFGPGGKAPTDPMSPEFAAYYGAYHGGYEPPFCMAAARQLFNQVR